MEDLRLENCGKNCHIPFQSASISCRQNPKGNMSLRIVLTACRLVNAAVMPVYLPNLSASAMNGLRPGLHVTAFSIAWQSYPHSVCFFRTRHDRTAAWPRDEGEETLRNALVRGQASVLLFMAPKWCSVPSLLLARK